MDVSDSTNNTKSYCFVKMILLIMKIKCADIHLVNKCIKSDEAILCFPN